MKQYMKRFVLDARPATNHFPGIGRYVSNLAQEMVPLLKDDEQLVILRDRGQPSRWVLPTPSDQVEIVGVDISPFGIKQQWQIPALLKELRATVYHSTYYLMPYFFNVPTAVTIYDLIPQHFPAYVSARARLLFQVTTRLALRQADHLISISEATSRDFTERYASAIKPITTTHLAPDGRFQVPSEAAVAQVRQKHQLPEAYVLYLGINKPHKNLGRLVEAWEQVKTTATLVIAGAWDERYPAVKAYVAASEMSNVRFLGPVDSADLPSLYAGAELFVFPSEYEGFGLPVIEAMACGTAVACADTSSLPEVGGAAVAYFSPTNKPQITQQLQQLLDNPQERQEMAAAGLAQAKKFTWAQTAAGTLGVYRALGGWSQAT